MYKIHTSIEINTDVNKVWKIITDFQNYTKWNTFILKMNGKCLKGSKLELTIPSVDGKKNVVFSNLTLKTFIKNKQISWEGKIFFKFLFYGHHILKLEPLSKNKTYFINEEYVYGILPHINKKNIYNNTYKGFNKMNLALKKYAENNKT